MKRKCLAIGIILLFVVVTIAPTIAQNTEKSQSASRGNWLYVGGSGPGNYTRIQDAVDNASSGDTVFVYNDHSPYKENIVINVSIRLMGENPSSTIVDGMRKDYVFRLLRDNIEITGFTIQNATVSGMKSSGINVESCYNIITNNIITNNNVGMWMFQTNNHYNVISNNIIKGSRYEGLYLYDSHSNIISNNTIIENGGCGVFLFGTVDYNLIADNNISKNDDEGIFSTGAKHDTIIRNIFIGNRLNGFLGIGTDDVNFSDNYFKDNAAGMEFYSSINRNIIRNNVFINDGYLGLVHNNIFSNNTVNGNPLLVLTNQHNRIIEGDYGQVLVDNCSNLTLQYLDISYTSSAIILDESENCCIQHTVLTSNDAGVDISKTCKNNIVKTNHISQNTHGVALSGISTLVLSNNITNNTYGIFQQFFGSNTNISHNFLSGNEYGIYMYNAFNCIFRNNKITSNDEGIHLSEIYNFSVVGNEISDNIKGISISNKYKDISSKIIRNNFLKNQRQVKFLNTWPAFCPGKWDSNFWDNKHDSGPKLLVGYFAYFVSIYYNWEYILVIPWIEVDWHPAQIPYDPPGGR
jgi:parallel beta-helix repeat protein